MAFRAEFSPVCCFQGLSGRFIKEPSILCYGSAIFHIIDMFKGPVFFIVTLINFFGNLAIFIPIGLFPVLLFRGATWKRSAIIGFGMSSFIEIAQYFIMRNTAVDDIILNTAGAMCGYLIYLFIRKRFPRFSAGFLCHEQ